MYKKGDRVLFWSLQSFHGPGFYCGHPATVKQDQIGRSVLVLPDDKGRRNPVQESYEVYAEQCKLLDAELENLMNTKEDLEARLEYVNKRLRTYDY